MRDTTQASDAERLRLLQVMYDELQASAERDIADLRSERQKAQRIAQFADEQWKAAEAERQQAIDALREIEAIEMPTEIAVKVGAIIARAALHRLGEQP